MHFGSCPVIYHCGWHDWIFTTRYKYIFTSSTTTMMFEILMTLAFVAIFIVVHLVFKNIHDIFIWSCKIITATYLWAILWIITQLHKLPEWQLALTASMGDLYSNFTSFTNFTSTSYDL